MKRACTFALLLFGFFVGTTAQEKPNIVLFLADDCTYWDIGAYGSNDALTPNIDALAAEGIKFTRCFQAAPMCSPTRHNLLTGLYPVRSGAYPNHTFVQAGTQSIVQYLRPLGYRVALSGKRHISPRSVFDFEYLGDKKNPDFALVDSFIADAVRKNAPFCLFLTSNEPHAPWDKGNPQLPDPATVRLPPTWVDTPETRKAYCRYLAEVSYMDKQVGKALELLDSHGVAENTVFIFTSEQGNGFPFAKWTCYNAGLHSAFIARWPKVAGRGIISEALIDYTDIVPTIIELAGGRIPSGLDGESFLNVLQGKAERHKDYSFGMQTTRGILQGSEYYGIRAVTDGHYRLIMNLSPEAEFRNITTDPEKGREWWFSWLKAAQTDSFAMQRVEAYRKRPAWELYDDIRDPYNRTNLAGKKAYEKIGQDLKRELFLWMEDCGDKGKATEMEAISHQVKPGGK